MAKEAGELGIGFLGVMVVSRRERMLGGFLIFYLFFLLS